MSITDVQRAFVRGLDGKASCKIANIDLEDGGHSQRLSFHVVSSSHGSAYLSETIPADMCPMQHARKMAMDFIEGRIANGSRMASGTSVPASGPAAVPPSLTPPPVPNHYVSAVPQSPTPAMVQAPANDQAEPNLPPDPPSASPLDMHGEQIRVPVPDELLNQAIETGDRDWTVDLLCQMVDDDAGAIRAAWTTNTPGQGLEYDQVRREINDIAYGLVDATPENAPCLWASVGVDVPKTGDDEVDIRTAAALINQCINQTAEFLSRIRTVRLRAKSAIRSAETIEQALELYPAIEWPTA